MFEIFLFPKEVSFCSVDLPSYVTAPFQINRTLRCWCLCSGQTKNVHCQQRLWGQGCEGLNIALAMTPMMEWKRSFSSSLCFCVVASKKRSLFPAPALCGTITMRYAFKLSCLWEGKWNKIEPRRYQTISNPARSWSWRTFRSVQQTPGLQWVRAIRSWEDTDKARNFCSELEPWGSAKLCITPEILYPKLPLC